MSRKRIFPHPVALRPARSARNVAIFPAAEWLYLNPTVLCIRCYITPHFSPFLPPSSLSPLRIKIANLRDARNRSADDNGRSARAGRAQLHRKCKAADKRNRYQILTATTANMFARTWWTASSSPTRSFLALLFGHPFTSLTLNCVTLLR